MDLDHISPSMLRMFCTCQRQFSFRYLEGLKMPPGIAAIAGTGMHKAAEANHVQKVKTGKDLPLDDMKDVARDGFLDAVEKNLDETGSRVLLEAGENEGKVLDKGLERSITLTEVYGTIVAPSIFPSQVEQTYSCSVDSVERPFLGIIDVLDKSGKIIDLKSASKRWASTKPDSELQPVIYRKLLQANGVEAVGFQFYVITPKGEMQVLEAHPQASDFIAVAGMAKGLEAALKSGVFMPAPRDSWVCSEKWCGYHHICEYAKRVF